MNSTFKFEAKEKDIVYDFTYNNGTKVVSMNCPVSSLEKRAKEVLLNSNVQLTKSGDSYTLSIDWGLDIGLIDVGGNCYLPKK